MNLQLRLARRVNALRRLVGRSGSVSPSIPTRFLIQEMVARGVELTRGIVRFQTLTFVGYGVKVRRRSALDLGRYVVLGRRCDIDALGTLGVILGDGSRLGKGCVVTTTSHISRLGVGLVLGSQSSFGDYCHFGASGGIRIGDNVIGGPFVSFHSQNHVFTSTSIPIKQQGTTERGIQIGNNCWIGAKATFVDGSVVASGSVVAAGAVVSGNYSRPAVLGGVPAEIIRFLDD